MPKPSDPVRRVAVLRGLARYLPRLALIAVPAVLLHLGLDQIVGRAAAMPGSSGDLLMGALLAALLVAYALLIAVPFVPGVEIGISLMLLRGADVAPFVYLATLGGLCLAFFAGRFLPDRVLGRLFADLRMTGAARLMARIAPLSQRRRLVLLRRLLPHWLGRRAVRYRHLGLALLLNLPGSALIGGGGAIALVAGLSRLFRPAGAVLTFALAVLPVPLAVWLLGPSVLGR